MILAPMWLVQTVTVEALAETLTTLERTHPPSGQPILLYIDQTRVLIAWRYRGS